MSFILNIERQERTSFSTVINSFLRQQRTYINSQITAVLYTVWKVESQNGLKLDCFFPQQCGEKGRGVHVRH